MKYIINLMSPNYHCFAIIWRSPTPDVATDNGLALAELWRRQSASRRKRSTCPKDKTYKRRRVDNNSSRNAL